MRPTLLAIAMAAVLASGLRGAHAFGHGGPGGCMGRRAGMGMGMGDGAGMLPLPLLLSVMTPDQRAQVGELMKAEKPAMRSLVAEQRTGHAGTADRGVA